jgi:hypothetical protein
MIKLVMFFDECTKLVEDFFKSYLEKPNKLTISNMQFRLEVKSEMSKLEEIFSKFFDGASIVLQLLLPTTTNYIQSKVPHKATK